ncbi:MAG: cytidine deaminase [Endozoicomonas sp. (ex Botrylloides leachii)]|nr:cytidine deaminase [Endozoicomonas sp. (ex Botrylloides leachii)]
MMTPAFQEELTGFSPVAAASLNNIKAQQGRLAPEQAHIFMAELSIPIDQLATRLLPLAASMSIHPISHFSVGAIVEGYREQGLGPLYFGANLEIPGQPLKMSIHAEQSAICNAWSQGETRLRRLIVNETPCGHCRQFLNELNKIDSTELMVNRSGSDQASIYSMQDLLPSAFGPNDLKQKQRLLLADPVALTLPSKHQEDDLARAATQAASQSYAPYSGCYSGVALKLEDGRIITGRYAENAAFNPSMQAVESALVNWRLAALEQPCTKVVDAVLVENNGRINHQATTASILGGYGITLRYIPL